MVKQYKRYNSSWDDYLDYTPVVVDSFKFLVDYTYTYEPPQPLADNPQDYKGYAEVNIKEIYACGVPPYKVITQEVLDDICLTDEYNTLDLLTDHLKQRLEQRIEERGRL